MFYIRLSILLCVVFICSCTKDIKEVSESPGLDTIPFYANTSLAFDTKGALKQAEEEKKAEEARKEELKKRLETQSGKSGLFDPWVPPAAISFKELPPALRGFPKDKFGYPDWTAAAKGGIVKPRSSIIEGIPEDAPFEQDILFEINDRLMANVLFSHKIHTFWLSCKICHPSIFIDKKGANKFTMYDIWGGRYCGRCHGKVAFQAKGFENCQRCHSVGKKTFGVR